MPGKSSVSVFIGRPSGLKFTDADRLALELGTQIFGGGFFSARLLDIIRNREGLTYGIGARLGNDTYTDGDWRITGTFAPELLAQGLASTQRELRRLVTEGVTTGELRDFKTAVSGTYKLSLATSGGLAARVLSTVQRGLPLSFVDDYPAQIHALTLDGVNAAIRKHLDPDKVITVLAGTLPGEGAAAAK
jgi:zinc protease